MTVEIAQRRLLEALAALNSSPDSTGFAASPLLAFAVGCEAAIEHAEANDSYATGRVYAALGDLAKVVDADLEVTR